MPTPRDALLRTLLLSLIAGGTLAAIGLPLGWMIGAMIASGYLGLRGAAAVPRQARPAALVVLGLALGQGFTEPVLKAVLAALPAMVVGGILAMGAGIAVAPLHRRIARADARTAFFAAIPGGVVTMAVLAAEAGASVAAVTLAQSIRMALVVLLYPVTLALFGHGGAASAAYVAELPPLHWGGLGLLLLGGAVVAWLGGRIRMTNAAMLAPCLLAMVLSANGILPSGVPRWMVNAAQLGMGASLGMLLAQEGREGAPRRLALAGMASAAMVSLLLLLAAIAIALWAELPLRTVVLGMAPGGMPEMAITAQALNLAVPLVLGFHLVRVILCNLLVMPLFRFSRIVGILR
ncbi:AbrB family transcriptional regulator [Roseomonas sp. HJA6]|uniref:AbrB family transcriptional regulator n=1 Tax=Roseomonas alba TaxID=2846776 RepID=A0ABS7A8B5_9PROT|nr:AbrB family transcriptional regulator [Neoroseomonas alba]MBW6398548.1 AbrB family transcriptional regulator [Neoroseomonas alba]